MNKKHTSHKSETDWQRVDALRDEDIDFSDCPEITAEMFAKATVRKGLVPIAPKAQIKLRLDADVLAWFKTQGKGYQTRINALLRAYMDAQRENDRPNILTSEKISA